MGEEDEGVVAGAGGELLPVDAAAAQVRRRVAHPVQVAGGHPRPRRRVAGVVAGRRRPRRLHERPDGGAAHQDLRRDGAVDGEHGLAVRPRQHGERQPVRVRGLPRRGHRRRARRAAVVHAGGRRGGAGDQAAPGGHAAGVRHQPHRGRVHLRVVGGGGEHARRGVDAVGAPGAPPRRAQGVAAAGGVARRRREGAPLDGVHRRRRQVLRHGVAQPEAVAAPPRAPPHHAPLPHVGHRPRHQGRRGQAAAAAAADNAHAAVAAVAAAFRRGRGRAAAQWRRRRGPRQRRQGRQGLVLQVPEHRPPPGQLVVNFFLFLILTRKNVCFTHCVIENYYLLI